MTDEEIITKINNGNIEATEVLINKYKGLVRAKARAYFLIGADREDIIQEGMIGLFKAIGDYRDDRQSSFKAFAELCITRQILTAIKNATRQKHIPLNSYVSLNKPMYDKESDKTVMDLITRDNEANPENILINDETYKITKDKIDEVLSKFELEVLTQYMRGKSYQEISGEVNREAKSIDNALQRIKKKLEKPLKVKNKR